MGGPLKVAGGGGAALSTAPGRGKGLDARSTFGRAFGLRGISPSRSVIDPSCCFPLAFREGGEGPPDAAANAASKS